MKPPSDGRFFFAFNLCDLWPKELAVGEDVQIGADGGVEAGVERFVDERVADGDLEHPRDGGEEGGEVGLAEVMPGVDAQAAGLGVNAGHDLSQANLAAFLAGVPGVEEVSIGHALIDEALYAGLDPTVRAYLRILAPS